MVIYEHSGGNTTEIPDEIKRVLVGKVSEYRVVCDYQRTGSIDSDTFLFEHSYGSWSEVTHFSGSNTGSRIVLKRATPSSGVSIEYMKGGIKKFAQQYIDKNKAMTAQWLSEKGMNTYTDKATGKVLSPEEVYRAAENGGEEYYPLNNAKEKAGAKAVEESAAAAVALSAAMMVTSKGKSLFKDPDTLKTIKKGFTGKLKGKPVDMPDVPTKELKYTKRSPGERLQLDKDAPKAKRKFNRGLVDSPEKIEALNRKGFTDRDITKLNKGRPPSGYQAHHKLPLDDGGSNDMSNFALTRQDPYHKTFTASQKSLTKGMKPSDTKVIEFPVPKGNLYPPTKPK